MWPRLQPRSQQPPQYLSKHMQHTHNNTAHTDQNKTANRKPRILRLSAFSKEGAHAVDP